ncbi:hypothetical protein J2T13_004994 [Paenibacillus sp. DS2015]|uniref:hypothetical protein n=1 Tax=Paenibacillus sp. DS2015 TaxID=3373917 RepID=UPI003D1FD96C
MVSKSISLISRLTRLRLTSKLIPKKIRHTKIAEVWVVRIDFINAMHDLYIFFAGGTRLSYSRLVVLPDV